MTTICILILAYWIMGKNVKPLLASVKNVDWSGMYRSLMEKLHPWAIKVGRSTTRPLLQFYYVMIDDKTSTFDRVLIYAAIIYTISPISILPTTVYRWLGVLDEGGAMLYVYRKIKGMITPEINIKVEENLMQWFGTEYELIEG